MFGESGFDFWKEQDNFFLLYSVQTISSPASYLIFTHGSYPRIKQLGHEADNLSPSNVEVKNAWDYTFAHHWLHGIIIGQFVNMICSVNSVCDCGQCKFLLKTEDWYWHYMVLTVEEICVCIVLWKKDNTKSLYSLKRVFQWKQREDKREKIWKRPAVVIWASFFTHIYKETHKNNKTTSTASISWHMM